MLSTVEENKVKREAAKCVGGYDLFKAETLLENVKNNRRRRASQLWLSMGLEERRKYEERAKEGGSELFIAVFKEVELARKEKGVTPQRNVKFGNKEPK